MKAFFISQGIKLIFWILKRVAREVIPEKLIPDICPIAKNGGCLSKIKSMEA